MIFVSLGTEIFSFPRLLRELENLINEGGIQEECIVQVGHTNYSSHLFKTVKFVSNSQFTELIQKADIIISHGGSGSLFNAIKKGKKVIAMARLKKYGEMIDDHQTELVKKLSQEGCILDGTNSLIEAYKKLDSFFPKPCIFPNEIVSNLKIYIDGL